MAPPCPPRVTLNIGSAAHHAGLPVALLRAGVLRAVVRLGPDLEMLEPDDVGGLKVTRRFASYRLGTRLLWAAWRRLPGLRRSAPLPVLAWSLAGDRIAARWIPDCDVFHGLTGVSLASLRRARLLGAATIIDTGSLHPSVWQREVLADCSAYGVRRRDCERLLPAVLMRRQEREFELCDRIVVYSAAAWRSFQAFPYAGKTVIVQPGVDHRVFAPVAGRERRSTFRACYVGRIEAAKGLHYLTAAWKRLALPNAELVLAGRVLPEMSPLRKEAGITLAGILTREQIGRLYNESDLFVYPSVNEGLPLALLEAMSCGLPAIGCRATGAEDCITAGSDGLLVTGRDVDALAEALQWCHGHREQLAGMGAAARERIEQEFTLAHYAGRLVDLYRAPLRKAL